MTQTPSQTCKAVVFSAAGHRFALPLGAIARIVHRSLLRSDRSVPGLVYFENQPLDLIHLDQLLQGTAAASTQVSPAAEPQFFILVHLGQQEGQQQGGIAATAPPVLMDLPLDQVHTVPHAYAQKLQGLASQMISLGNPATPETIFLLNLQQVATLTQQQLTPKRLPVL
ncbi:MAG: hypothetical protein HC771_07380 [Synechococcales cyanobacterium CRU_2_2]|nr:hypothetical protein [Synechococcales cyanobacterium CRU_2_2]